MSPPLRLIDLFAGCGGLTEGFVATERFVPVAAVEENLAAAATYASNFGEPITYHGKIEQWVENGDLPEADVVVGGPPCQGFSNLGARREHDDRNDMWRHYLEVLVRVKPRAFVLENVDRFAQSAQFKDLLRETETGRKLADYEIDVHVVNATTFDAPQRRRRAIVIGTRRDLDPIFVPQHTKPVAEWVTVRQALRGIPQHIHELHQQLPSATTSRFGHELPGAFRTGELHLTRHYTDLSLKRFDAIKPGGNRLELPDDLKAKCWLGHDKGSLDVMGRVHWDKPSVTIRTEFFKPEKGRYLHPEQDRAISHREAATLQGFRTDYQWCGTKIEIARQIGNAVPVQLARGIAAHLVARLDEQE